MGAGITWLKNNGFFTADYYPYNAGALLSVKTSKKITTGKNLFDNSNFPSGYGSIVATHNTDGTVTFNGTASGNEYFSIPFNLPNTNYVLSVGNTSANANVHVSFVDHNSDFYGDNDLSTANKSVSVSSDIGSIVFYVLSGTTLTNFTIKPMLEFGSTATAYEPYTTHEYTLDGSKKVHRVFGTADEDSFTSFDGQTSPGGLHWVQCTVDNVRNGSAFTSMLEVKNTDDGWVSTTPCLTMENGRLVIYTSENSLADFKTAYANLEIVYELETPFDETVSNPELRGILKLDSDNNLYYFGDTCDDFTNPQIVDGNGTEQFVDGRTVEMPVGHSTIYVDDNDATKLDNLPDISNDGNGTYLVTQSNGQMSLDKYPIPNPPTTDGSYRLEVTVTDGVPAYTWEVIS